MSNGAYLLVNHREYLGNAWKNYVKYRVVVGRQKESASQFSGCVIFPNSTVTLALRFQYMVDNGGAFVL